MLFLFSLLEITSVFIILWRTIIIVISNISQMHKLLQNSPASFGIAGSTYD